MNLELIKKQTKKNFITGGVFGFLAILTFYFGVNYKTTDSSRISQLEKEIDQLRQDNQKLATDISQGKQFMEIITSVPAKQKSLSGIDTESANKKLNQIADLYFVKDKKFNFSKSEVNKDPEALTKHLAPFVSEIKLEFSALTDILAIEFLNKFVDELEGYWLIDEFSIKKTSQYSNEDLIKISKNSAKPVIESSVKIKWLNLSSKKLSEALSPDEMMMMGMDPGLAMPDGAIPTGIAPSPGGPPMP